ncbi:MAG: GGDEF domain-containing protein [Erysipelothrix sp.]|nr:GGDEF domain-containing protein [Erysipelothrix sp.]
MEKWLNRFMNQEKAYKQLSSDNSQALREYNQQTLSTLLRIGCVLSLLPIVVAPFSNTKMGAIPAYSLSFLSFFIMFMLFRIPAIKKYTLVGLYLSFTVLFLLGLYLSVVHSPHMRATIILGAFAIMPLSFIDRPYRVWSLLAVWLIIHTTLAFLYKPGFALDDTINCLCSAVLGGYFGNTLIKVRLESFEARRLLTIEKETDVLTGLYSRRKLFETLTYLETKDSEKPSGVMMLDIDYFKEYNDSYGHAAGDECLSLIGEVLRNFMEDFRLDFYRYGGEEFVALAYDYNEDELVSIAERLRTAVNNIDLNGQSITISIGVSYCGNEHVNNYENIIDRADKATYAAKREGRNKVCTE